MAKKPRHERIGFDPYAMIDALLGKLVVAGGIAKNDPRLGIWNTELPADADEKTEDYRNLSLIHLAGEHQVEHGIQKDGPHCHDFPCRVAGLCGAVVEIADYLIQAKDRHGFLAVSDAIQDFRPKRVVLRALLSWFADLQKENDKKRLVPISDGSRLALERLDALGEALDDLQAAVLAQLESQQFQQPDQGRPAERLLTAVYQHLHIVGGVPFEELAMLKLEIDGTDLTSENTEQLRASTACAIAKRVRGEDFRSWHPYRRRVTEETIPPDHCIS